LALHSNYDKHSNKQNLKGPDFMPRRTDLSDTYCPVGRSAELVGDRAVLLILRDLFFGVRRFEAFQANTGLGPQILADRLKRMEREGVVERKGLSAAARPPRILADRQGQGVVRHVLYAMRNWAERWAYAPGRNRI
jgi:DNA-binding HxlR family transcriptional regulator